MLRKLLAVLLLICHVNFFMFIAQVDEVDAYDSHGRRLNDINSLAEYINDTILGHNKPRPDEDDDNARYSYGIKFDEYNFSQIAGIKEEYLFAGKIEFPPCIQKKLSPVSLDFPEPPPKI